MTASGQDPVASRQLQDPPLGRPYSTAPRIPRALAVRDSLFDNAQHILDLVNARFGGGDAYLDQIYGPCITVDQANKIVVRHLKEEGLHGHIKVKWSPKLSCSACIVFRGYSRKLNKPEKRSYTLMLNSTKDNLYLREKAILALIDHEIGTHYVCTVYVCLYVCAPVELGLTLMLYRLLFHEQTCDCPFFPDLHG